MTTENAVILDLQRSLDAMTQDRDKHSVLVRGLARYIVTEMMKVTDADEIENKIQWLIGEIEETYASTATTHTARILRGK